MNAQTMSPLRKMLRILRKYSLLLILTIGVIIFVWNRSRYEHDSSKIEGVSNSSSLSQLPHVSNKRAESNDAVGPKILNRDRKYPVSDELLEKEIDSILQIEDMDKVRKMFAEIIARDGYDSIMIIVKKVVSVKGNEYVDALAWCISEAYRLDHLECMSMIIELIDKGHLRGLSGEEELSHAKMQRLVHRISEEVRMSGDLALMARAYTDLCDRPTQHDSAISSFASYVGEIVGYENALRMIPSSEKFGILGVQETTNEIIQDWMSFDSAACFNFVLNTPAGEKQNNYITAIIRRLARLGNFNEAEEWYRLLPPNASQSVSALDHIISNKGKK
jgi:hypothetical protein